MYNGIGLKTARGSGTNGYVQVNKAFVHVRKEAQGYRQGIVEAKPPVQRKPNKEILEHERKRKIEVKLLELRDEMEDAGVPEEQILKKIAEQRKKLRDEDIRGESRSKVRERPRETHAVADMKAKETEQMRAAFGIRRDYTTGEAFDRDLQEEKKKARQMEYEEKRQRQRDEKEKYEREQSKRRTEREKDRKRRRRCPSRSSSSSSDSYSGSSYSSYSSSSSEDDRRRRRRDYDDRRRSRSISMERGRRRSRS